MIHYANEFHALSHILANLRQRDVDEIRAQFAGTPDLANIAMTMYDQAPYKTIAYAADGEAVAFQFFNSLTPRALVASMLSTDRFHEVTPTLIRWGLKFFKPEALNAGFRRVECRTIAGHSEAIDYLQRLGFRLECDVVDFGANGETFHQYAWRFSDHVLRRTQDFDT